MPRKHAKGQTDRRDAALTDKAILAILNQSELDAQGLVAS